MLSLELQAPVFFSAPYSSLSYDRGLSEVLPLRCIILQLAARDVNMASATMKKKPP